MAYTQINMWWNIDYSYLSGNSFAQLTMSPLIFWGSNFLQLESLPYNAWVGHFICQVLMFYHQMVVEGRIFSTNGKSLFTNFTVSPSLLWVSNGRVSNASITFFTSVEGGIRSETWTMLATCSYPRRSHKGKESKIWQNSNPLTQPPFPLASVSLSRKLPESTLSPMSGQMLTWLVSMNGTPSSMVDWRIRLEILPLIGLTDSGFQSIYFMKNTEMEDEMSDDNSGAENSDNDSNSESDVDSGEENSDSDNDNSVWDWCLLRMWSMRWWVRIQTLIEQMKQSAFNVHFLNFRNWCKFSWNTHKGFCLICYLFVWNK